MSDVTSGVLKGKGLYYIDIPPIVYWICSSPSLLPLPSYHRHYHSNTYFINTYMLSKETEVKRVVWRWGCEGSVEVRCESSVEVVM